MAQPKIVSSEEWQRARAELLEAEKASTRAVDALAAQRRRLPMRQLTKTYGFDAPSGVRTLLELFDGRNELAVYQFMDRGPDKYCPGCTNVINNVPLDGLPKLARRGITWITVSNMPLAQIESYKARMGWTIPFVSSHGTSFAEDTGAGHSFLLSMLLRDGDKVYQTYSTTQRGVDRLLFAHNMMDLSAYGREEAWEDSPAGWPRHPTYTSGEKGKPAGE